MSTLEFSRDIMRRAQDALGGNSLIHLARNFAGHPAAALGALAGRAGFGQAAQALRSGRIDQLARAAGSDAIGLLAARGAQMVNRRMDAVMGKWGELLKAFDRSDPPPSGLVMLVLGNVPFMVGTLAHQTIARSLEYRWAVHERLLRTPSRQFVGPGSESVTLEGYALPHHTGGGDTLLRLRALAETGEPQILVDHFGTVHGRYVVERIEQTGSELDMAGQPGRIEFSIELAAYGEDAPVRTAVVTIGPVTQMDEDVPPDSGEAA